MNSFMLTEGSHTKSKAGSDSDPITRIDNIIESKELKAAVKTGLKQPYAKVLLRLTLMLLVITSVVLFLTAILRYGELRRESETLEKERDALTLEVEELRYLIDCPVDYDYIVRVAREKLNLHLPDEIVYYNDYNE